MKSVIIKIIWEDDPDIKDVRSQLLRKKTCEDLIEIVEIKMIDGSYLELNSDTIAGDNPIHSY